MPVTCEAPPTSVYNSNNQRYELKILSRDKFCPVQHFCNELICSEKKLEREDVIKCKRAPTVFKKVDIFDDFPLIDSGDVVLYDYNYNNNVDSNEVDNSEHCVRLERRDTFRDKKKVPDPLDWKRETTYDGSPIYRLGEKASGLRSRGDVQDFKTIQAQNLASGTLFRDPNFPANDSSLLFSRAPERKYKWLRPKDICKDPQFFVEGYSRFDIQQGELGDCWFIAAAANLTVDQNLFFRVVPFDQSFHENYAGVFHFRFWQYGKWIDVVIDDRLPTYEGKLVYMHSSHQNEFWSALLEKAYAKLYGSYEALKGGSTCEAMEDFTGGVGEVYDLNNKPPPNLFSILLRAYERNSLMAASLEADPDVVEAETRQGLIKGHAYSVTKVHLMEIATPNKSGVIQMLRLRNPWGNETEWNGPWSDKSPEWRFIPDEVKKEIGLIFDDDGEFWISFTDFIKYFDKVEICNLSPDSLTEAQQEGRKKKWEMSVFEGEWTPGVTSGGCRNYLETFAHNPQYVVKLDDPDEEDDDGTCTIIIALTQKNRRAKRNMGMDHLTIGFAVYRLSEQDLEDRPVKMEFFKYHASVGRSADFINLRDVTARFKFPPGHYLIVPSTFHPNEEGEFLIRVFSETKNNMEENDEEIGLGDVDDRVSEFGDDVDGDRHTIIASLPDSKKPNAQISALEKLFIEIAGDDLEVDWIELKRILDHSLRNELPKVQEGKFKSTKIGFVNTRQSVDGNIVEGSGTESGERLRFWWSLLCGAFCKSARMSDAFGVHEPLTISTIGNQMATPEPDPYVPQEGFSKDVCRSMIAMMDVDQSGKLGFEEFRTLLTDIAKWKAVFKLYDTSSIGKISAFQLREALNSAGYRLNNRVLNALAHRYGSGDGTIHFDDFLLCTIKIKTMMDIFKARDVNGTNLATFSMDEWVEKTIYS